MSHKQRRGKFDFATCICSKLVAEELPLFGKYQRNLGSSWKCLQEKSAFKCFARGTTLSERYPLSIRPRVSKLLCVPFTQIVKRKKILISENCVRNTYRREDARVRPDPKSSCKEVESCANQLPESLPSGEDLQRSKETSSMLDAWSLTRF